MKLFVWIILNKFRKRHDVLYINEIDKIPELEKILIVETETKKNYLCS